MSVQNRPEAPEDNEFLKCIYTDMHPEVLTELRDITERTFRIIFK